ncbi:MAG: ATP-binding cassette domain-containing protein [Alphaproteobacteria bacterium]
MPLELHNLGAEIDGLMLFDGLSETIAAGEVLSVMGPSGSGKTTLLNIIAGFAKPPVRWRGTLHLNGQAIEHQRPEQRRLGLVFQTPLLFPHLSVGQNLAFGIPSEISGTERQNRIEEALSSAGLSGFAARDPQSLSGGQRARVSLLRTLLSQPKALLLDEPFSSLDEATKDDMRAFTAAQIAAHSLPTVLVTHDPRDAAALSARVLTLPGMKQPDRVPLPTPPK